MRSSENLLSLPSKPFNSIAIAISGGGFRSACFSLGTLNYLNKLKISADNNERLIQRITYISSSSGGSITSSLFAKYYAEGIFNSEIEEGFYKFYWKLFNFMEGDYLIKEVFSSLESWNPNRIKSKNLINAFAEVYDKKLFEGATFEKLLKIEKNEHILDICINSTEFATGISFRFQTINGEFNRRGFGNNYVGLTDEKVARKIKLGDILASSSCFPSGFEPMVFPDDFTHSELSLEELKNSTQIQPITDYFESHPPTWISEKKFGLMDGGIVDNQGLNSLLLASQRNSPFDLVFINDVSSYFMNSYEVPTESKKGITFFLSPILLLAVIIFSIFTIVTIYGLIPDSTIKKYFAYIGYGFLLGSFVIGLGAWRLIKYILTGNIIHKKDESSWSSILNIYKHKFFSYRFSVLSQMIRSRISSTLILNNDVYLKQIRRLSNQKIFENPNWFFKRLSNVIYELSFTNNQSRVSRVKEEKALAGLFVVNKEIQKVAEKAYRMSTTLWFSKKEKEEKVKEAIIACGQFTTCYNLYKYILRLEEGKKMLLESSFEIKKQELSEESWQNLQFIKEQLEYDWAKFLENPYFLLPKS